jgi:AcrR family transcriptional regulator
MVACRRPEHAAAAVARGIPRAGGFAIVSIPLDPEPVVRGRLRPEKREAIMRGARGVFARVGYERASIDTIAAEAEVSTRTVYKHFDNKMQLLSEVLVSGAAEVATAFIAELAGVPLESDAHTQVAALARAIVAHRVRFPEHFALISRAGAESDLLPEELVDAWIAAGPRPVREAIIDRLTRLAANGDLRVADPAVAARHLVALAMSTMTTEPRGGHAPTRKELAAAVDAFLHGHSVIAGARRN